MESDLSDLLLPQKQKCRKTQEISISNLKVDVHFQSSSVLCVGYKQNITSGQVAGTCISGVSHMYVCHTQDDGGVMLQLMEKYMC